METVLFYTKENCSLCEDAYALLKMLQHDYSFQIEEVNIYENDELLLEYQLLIPAMRMNGTLLTCEQMDLEQMERVIKQNLNVK